jgi:hypothetical protein
MGTAQQSWPGPQHCPPQQNSEDGQAMPLHGGWPQVPLSQ